MLQQVTKLQLHQVAIWLHQSSWCKYPSMHHSHLPLALLLARQHHCSHLARHLARLAHLLPLVLQQLE